MDAATLTPSGAGVLLEGLDLERPADFAELQAQLERFRFVILRGATPDLKRAVDTMRRFGPINEAKTRDEGAVLVEDQGQEEVFRSSFPLPLHKDGLLTGFDVLTVGIYCVAFEDVQGGRTYVSDANLALERIDPEEVEILRQNGCEGQAVDHTGYYRPEWQDRWMRAPAFQARPGREPTLGLGLPHAPGEPESWRIRIADVPTETSDRILLNLRQALLDPHFTYFHEWRPGDLMLLDNYQVLHGREGFQAKRRALANIQVIAES
ncbi:MAG: TauD/TfdA family dioxygenase [Planctomycetota bacterium]|jgi:alpha-ketoglutarate-dependent taurine dioxygenase